MKKILFILSFLRMSDKAIHKTLQLAKEKNAELLLFFVLDIEYADRLSEKLTEEGWIGNKPSERLYSSILDEFKMQAEMKIAEISRRASEMDVPVRSVIKSGEILAETQKITREESPDLIIISRRKRSNLSRLIFGSLSNDLKKQVNREVLIIDSE